MVLLLQPEHITQHFYLVVLPLRALACPNYLICCGHIGHFMFGFMVSQLLQIFKNGDVLATTKKTGSQMLDYRHEENSTTPRLSTSKPNLNAEMA